VIPSGPAPVTPSVHRQLHELRGRLFRMAYAWSHDRSLADDLVQETLARAMERIGQLRDPTAMDTWVFSILNNCHRDHFRRLKEQTGVEEEAGDAALEPDQLYERYAAVRRVHDAIAALPDAQRQVLTLVDIEGFKYAEVAQTLGIPAGTVMSRLCRARQAVKERLHAASTRMVGPGVHLRSVK